MKNIGILGIQMGWTKDKEDNLNRALNFIDDGMKNHPDIDIICLPELFYAVPKANDIDGVCENRGGHFEETFRACAKKYGVNILTGTFPESREGKIYNTCLAINREGEVLGSYSKTHLFDAFDRRESDTFAAGDTLGIFDFDFGRVGAAVCYELRFSDYLRTVALENIDLLMVPSMFYRPRDYQWDTLTKAAAIQNQVYVAAINQYNHHCFGHSCIVKPDGLPAAEARDGEGWIFAEADMEFQQQVRRDNPIYENRRPELYHI